MLLGFGLWPIGYQMCDNGEKREYTCASWVEASHLLKDCDALPQCETEPAPSKLAKRVYYFGNKLRRSAPSSSLSTSCLRKRLRQPTKREKEGEGRSGQKEIRPGEGQKGSGGMRKKANNNEDQESRSVLGGRIRDHQLQFTCNAPPQRHKEKGGRTMSRVAKLV